MTTPSAGGEKFKDSLSVVIPTYKEARRLPATLRAVVDYLESRFESFEVIVVDDNSPDGTGDIVRGYSSRRPHVRLLVQPGREPAARDHFAAAVRFSPNTAIYRFNLGAALSLWPESREAARQEFATALKLDPNFSAAADALRRLSAAP